MKFILSVVIVFSIGSLGFAEAAESPEPVTYADFTRSIEYNICFAHIVDFNEGIDFVRARFDVTTLDEIHLFELMEWKTLYADFQEILINKKVKHQNELVMENFRKMFCSSFNL